MNSLSKKINLVLIIAGLRFNSRDWHDYEKAKKIIFGDKRGNNCNDYKEKIKAIEDFIFGEIKKNGGRSSC